MLARYVVADLWRNPRRTLSTMAGVSLGVGLFCGVLFFVDGLSASMTQRAVEPLALDMQRIVTERAASTLTLSQSVEGPARLGAGRRARVVLELHNPGSLAANEVTVRSQPSPDLEFVAGSAEVDGEAVTGFDDNPFASGAGRTGYNLGRVGAGVTLRMSYRVEATTSTRLGDDAVATTYSSRESVNPVAANRPPPAPLADLSARIAEVPGVARASQLSLADLGPQTLSSRSTTSSGPAKIFGFDEDYATHDPTIRVVRGSLSADGAVVSAEAARELSLSVGDDVTVALPDGSDLDLVVSGVSDLSRSRSLFSSRRGGDLETFVYTRSSVIVSPALFADEVFPAYERAVVAGTGRLKSPPVREVDITLDRELLDADPATASRETEAIAADVMAVAAEQDYLLDNITNTLTVAAGDAAVAKRLFVFLGLPGGFLAAILAAYAGNVLAGAQRREQATLRIRGAGRQHLLRMLALRTALLTAVGAVAGLVAGYLAAAGLLGRESLDRASTASLVTSGLVGTLGGFSATGLALYLTGRRSIDREINEDRSRLHERSPFWRRAGLDIAVAVLLLVGTVVAVRTHAFDGAAGSVYFGRSVELNLRLLVLPLAAWLTGSLLAARLVVAGLSRSRPASSPHVGRPAVGLLRRSIGRRPWAISTGSVVVSLIVGLAISLAAFTASYDAAKVADARYANGADIRITPSPTAAQTYTSADAALFRTPAVTGTAPVVYGLSNVILRSARTSDPANLAAVDVSTYAAVAPLEPATARMVARLAADPGAILVGREMADYLQAERGDHLDVLLARATDDQVETRLRIAGLFERLPGFPDGADAIMALERHTALVPAKAPDFFLASTGPGDEALGDAVDQLRTGPAAADHLQIDTRVTTLDRDQSSLAALNIAGLVDLDSGFALAMAGVTIAMFVFGLLLQRRREYVTLRAQGLEARTVRLLIASEAAAVALAGTVVGVLVGAAMGFYLVTVLRPLFVLTPAYTLPLTGLVAPALLVLVATVVSSVLGSRLVNGLQPTELLRDE